LTYIGIISNGPSAKTTAPRLLEKRPQILITINHLAADYACDWWVMSDWWPFTTTVPLLHEGRQPTLVCRRDWVREMDAAHVPHWQAWPRFYLEDIAPAIPAPDSPDVPLARHRHGNHLDVVRWDGFSGRAALGVAYWLCRREQFMVNGSRSIDVALCGYDNGGTDGAHDVDAKRANRTDHRWVDERLVFEFFMRAFAKIGVEVTRF